MSHHEKVKVLSGVRTTFCMAEDFLSCHVEVRGLLDYHVRRLRKR